VDIHKQGRQRRTRAHANEDDARNRDLRNNGGGGGDSCNNDNGGGGCMGPFLAAHSLPRLQREPEGVISPPARSLARNASGQAFFLAAHPLPRLKREPEGVPHDVAIPSPETQAGGLLAAHPLAPQTLAGLLLAAHPLPRLKREPEVSFYFITVVFVFTILVTHVQ
jgi:hypothetical protein